ncbi:hypothetical protein THC_0395 [Caldimicrobium thiodismutans]|jgi:flagellar biosynthesis component FlhA|uniref:Uncharacterized protein n=1 Tax=Caldimicrobium thiodismutans TaxID=1653476 RepID=A0A0U5AFL5_9BACT|nr:hypothetical protein [Caldimicrobium thiodismutans]BAU22791.1 hypothetical protein THC_0395 [Caldimicrobium thiodismutans]
MGDIIKSALEIALEKAEKIGKASPEELEWERLKERALSLVGKYLKRETQDFKGEVKTFLAKVPERHKKKVLKVVLEALLKNLTLPKEEYHLKDSQELLKTLKDFLNQIPQVDKLLEETQKMLQEYFFQKEALYQEMVRRFSASLNALEKAVSQQMGTEVKLSPEAHPQFQEEWRKIKDRLDQEYERQLEYIKALLLKIFA